MGANSLADQHIRRRVDIGAWVEGGQYAVKYRLRVETHPHPAREALGWRAGAGCRSGGCRDWDECVSGCGTGMNVCRGSVPGRVSVLPSVRAIVTADKKASVDDDLGPTIVA